MLKPLSADCSRKNKDLPEIQADLYARLAEIDGLCPSEVDYEELSEIHHWIEFIDRALEERRNR